MLLQSKVFTFFPSPQHESTALFALAIFVVDYRIRPGRMDPASVVGLVAACSSLTKQCASVVNTLHGLVETYKNAELAILSIAEECSTVEYAWRRIAEWAEGNLYDVEDFEELGERLQRSIYCGELVLSALEEEVMDIQSNSNSFKRRISLLWNNGIFVEHQTRLRGQVAALQLLLQVLSL